MKKIISLASGDKGGVSKTTTAINLASGLSRTHSVVLVDLDRSKQSTKFNSVKNNLTVVSFDLGKELSSFLENSNADFIIIDLGGYDSELQRWALFLSDLIILPTSSSDSDLIELFSFTDKIQDIIFTKDNDYARCLILASAVHNRSSCTQKELKEVYDSVPRIKVMSINIARGRGYDKMMSSGKSIFEMYNTRAIKDNEKLVNEILEECR